MVSIAPISQDQNSHIVGLFRSGSEFCYFTGQSPGELLGRTVDLERFRQLLQTVLREELLLDIHRLGDASGVKNSPIARLESDRILLTCATFERAHRRAFGIFKLLS